MNSKTFKKYLSDFQKIKSREKIIIFSILIASFLIGIFGSYTYKYITKKQVLETSQEIIIPSPFPKTAFTKLESTANQLAIGDRFDVTLSLNSRNLGVEAADFVVNLDPDYLKVANVSTGTFFKNYPINTTGDNFVKISGVADFTEKSIIVPKGEGTIATITFETLRATESTKITIDKLKTVVASSGQNILDVSKLDDLMINITP